MDKTALGISSLNGQWRAAALHRGRLVSSWERTGLLNDFSAVATVLRESAAQTASEARQVAVVLAHPQLSQQVVEVPPAKGWALQQFIERRVQAIKAFDGEPAWSRQPALATRKGPAALVHLCPKQIVDQLSGACAAAGMELARVLPASAVLAGQLKQLPLARDEVALLAAETGSTITVVIGRKDGVVCLTRTLLMHWDRQAEQVAVNLTRTIGFAEQQSGVEVNSVWLFGPTAQAHEAELQTFLKRPVQVSPVAPAPFYWAEQAVNLPGRDDGNLVTLEALQAPQRRRFLTLTSAILILLLCASLGTAAYLEVLRRSHVKAIVKLNADAARLQDKKSEWTIRYDDLAQKKEVIKEVQDGRPPPVAAWFLAYLGGAVPDDMVLTHLQVERTNKLWSVRLGGSLQPGTNAPTGGPLSHGYGFLTNRLMSGPFRMEITRSEVGGRIETRSGTNWVVLPETNPASAPKDTNRFLIEGTMR